MLNYKQTRGKIWESRWSIHRKQVVPQRICQPDLLSNGTTHRLSLAGTSSFWILPCFQRLYGRLIMRAATYPHFRAILAILLSLLPRLLVRKARGTEILYYNTVSTFSTFLFIFSPLVNVFPSLQKISVFPLSFYFTSNPESYFPSLLGCSFACWPISGPPRTTPPSFCVNIEIVAGFDD